MPVSNKLFHDNTHIVCVCVWLDCVIDEFISCNLDVVSAHTARTKHGRVHRPYNVLSVRYEHHVRVPIAADLREEGTETGPNGGGSIGGWTSNIENVT